MKVEKHSKIQSFYSNKSIFITGATGFVGKLLLLKLLISCPEINKIYVLLRPKNNEDFRSRLSQMFNTLAFTYVFKDNEKLKNKVIPIAGDITSDNFGLSSSDRQTIIDKVEIVFHFAASVRFDDPLKDYIKSNIFGTKQMIDLCKQIRNLLAFIHCSTAYSHCQRLEVNEMFYDIKCDPKKMLELSEWFPSEALDLSSEHLMEGRPNKYTFTKALAEELVYRECQSIRTAVVRPSIVFNADKEPLPGWVDNFNGPGGIAMMMALGILRYIDLNYKAKADFVPVDKVVNAIITIG